MGTIDLHAMFASLGIGLIIMIPIYLVIYSVITRTSESRDERRARLARATLQRQLMDTGPIGPRHLAEV